DLHLMELFHGPTLAFKDVAMQVLGGLFDHVLAKRDQRVTIIGATSGDTGSAAIEAVRGRERASIFILHPHGRTSDVQRKQMTTVDAPNVFNLAIDGTFDDCQNLLKAMFNDTSFRDEVNMSGVNSINWARLMPQIVYYFTAALALHGEDAATRPTSFSVPTGNFGDIYAGYAAAQMGLPVGKLVIASNQNDILTRVMNTGEHTLGPVARTLAPSMDIQISSNFERLLFDMLGRDGDAVAQKMNQLKAEGTFSVSPDALEIVRPMFAAHRVDEDQTLSTMKQVFDTTGELMDPHTAIGVASAQRELEAEPDLRKFPMVVLGTAHPAKFPDAVERATAIRPALPEHLADLYEREEKYDVLPNDLAAVEAHIRQRF
ncbi:MAG: threonine synthase, partial [Planctomycetota bacterium]